MLDVSCQPIMKLIVSDETNREAADGRFFLMGALVFDADRLGEIHHDVMAIRQRYGFRPDDSFKYALANKPAHVTKAGFDKAKGDALDLLAERGVLGFVYLCHRQICDPRGEQEKFQWGADGILWPIQRYLQGQSDYAISLQDRHPVEGEFDYYKRRFAHAAAGKGTHQLSNIVCFGSTCDNASTFSSLADIFVGSFRFCVNNPDKDRVCSLLLPKLLGICHGSPNWLANGIVFRPNEVRRPDLALEYDQVREHFRAHGSTQTAGVVRCARSDAPACRGHVTKPTNSQLCIYGA